MQVALILKNLKARRDLYPKVLCGLTIQQNAFCLARSCRRLVIEDLQGLILVGVAPLVDRQIAIHHHGMIPATRGVGTALFN